VFARNRLGSVLEYARQCFEVAKAFVERAKFGLFHAKNLGIPFKDKMKLLFAEYYREDDFE
jgi:hypothetical protein